MRILLIILIVVCTVGITSPGQASSVITGEGLDWEMSILPKATPEELEKERWQPILENNIGIYTYASDSLVKKGQKATVLVKTVFTNAEIIDKLNLQYAEKLSDGEKIESCQLQMVFDIAEKKYCVEKTEIYSNTKQVISVKELKKSEIKLLEIPENSFAEAMLEKINE